MMSCRAQSCPSGSSNLVLAKEKRHKLRGIEITLSCGRWRSVSLQVNCVDPRRCSCTRMLLRLWARFLWTSTPWTLTSCPSADTKFMALKVCVCMCVYLCVRVHACMSACVRVCVWRGVLADVYMARWCLKYIVLLFFVLFVVVFICTSVLCVCVCVLHCAFYDYLY